MSESPSHKRAKARAAGKGGQTEVPISGGRRLDAATDAKATEVERSGDIARLRKAAARLNDSGKRQKVLIVPQPDMKKAAAAMVAEGVSGTVKNLSGTKRRSVKK